MKINHPIPKGIWVRFDSKEHDAGGAHVGQVLDYKDHKYMIGNCAMTYLGIHESKIVQIIDEVVEAQRLGMDPKDIRYKIDRKVFVEDLKRLMASGGSAAGTINTSR